MLKRILFSGAVALAALSASAALPSVTLKDMNGKSVDTAEIGTEGKPVVVSFFCTLV